MLQTKLFQKFQSGLGVKTKNKFVFFSQTSYISDCELQGSCPMSLTGIKNVHVNTFNSFQNLFK